MIRKGEERIREEKTGRLRLRRKGRQEEEEREGRKGEEEKGGRKEDKTRGEKGRRLKGERIESSQAKQPRQASAPSGGASPQRFLWEAFEELLPFDLSSASLRHSWPSVLWYALVPRSYPG